MGWCGLVSDPLYLVVAGQPFPHSAFGGWGYCPWRLVWWIAVVGVCGWVGEVVCVGHHVCGVVGGPLYPVVAVPPFSHSVFGDGGCCTWRLGWWISE